MVKLQMLPEEVHSLQVLNPIIKTGVPIIVAKRITENGKFSAKEEGATGFDPVEVAVDLTPAYDAGYAKGEKEGYEKGHTDGVADGIEQGKAEAIESLPTGYIKVDPTWTDFAYFCAGRRFSLGKNLKYSDTANGKTFSNMFYGWDTGEHTVPSLDLRKGTNFSGMFSWSSCIVEIGEMDISNATNVTGMFNSCNRLERISFVPGCLKISISFANSDKLHDASIQSIIDGLADLTGKTTQTLTLHATVGGKLTQAQKDAASAKNWTLAY